MAEPRSCPRSSRSPITAASPLAAPHLDLRSASHAAAPAPLDRQWLSPAATPVAAPPLRPCWPRARRWPHPPPRAVASPLAERTDESRAPRREPPRARWPRARTRAASPAASPVPERCASAAASPLGARTPVAAPRAPARCPSGHAGARSSRSPVAERPRRARADLGCPSDRANSGGRIAGKDVFLMRKVTQRRKASQKIRIVFVVRVFSTRELAGVQSIASEVMEVFAEMPSRCRMLNCGGTLPADNGGSW